MRLLYAHRHYMTGVTQRGFEIFKGLGDAWLNHPSAGPMRGIA